MLMDYYGEPPVYMIGLLGTAAGTFFGSISSDKEKRDADIARTAHRAEAKVDALAEVAETQHPGSTDKVQHETGESGQ